MAGWNDYDIFLLQVLSLNRGGPGFRVRVRSVSELGLEDTGYDHFESVVRNHDHGWLANVMQLHTLLEDRPCPVALPGQRDTVFCGVSSND